MNTHNYSRYISYKKSRLMLLFSLQSLGQYSHTHSLSCQGLGTTDSVLIRIMVARAEIDMLDIKAQFLKIYGKTLHSFIKVRQ